jgi:hypothetical protein
VENKIMIITSPFVIILSVEERQELTRPGTLSLPGPS